MDWVHVGRAKAERECHLLSVRAAEFAQCLQEHRVLLGIAAEYCHGFHERLVSACPPDLVYPDDLRVPRTDFCDTVVSMSRPIQVTVGLQALEHFPRQPGARLLNKLREEVETSKSIVVITETGTVLRVVSLVVLRATTHDDGVLMQVGKYDAGGVQAVCRLPGAKQAANEIAEDALTRILSTKLGSLGSSAGASIPLVPSARASKSCRASTGF